MKNEFSITFNLPADVNTPCRIVYYASGKNGGMIRETVADIAGGKGEITLPQRYPAIVFLFASGQRQPSAILYIGRGDKLKATGKSGDMTTWEISGNPVSEALSEWRISNASLLAKGDADKINAEVAKYVKKHPDSKAAAIILYFHFTRRGHEKEFFKLQNMLSKDVIEDEWLMHALSSADLLTNLPDTPTLPRRIIFTSDSGYADTLRLKGGKGALLMFRKNDDSGIAMDSVKSLLKNHTAGNAAELYIETDSLNWRRHVRQDTIEGLRRLWMPMGLADSLAITMGVRRVPLYIVVGPDGKELYRGDDWEKAATKYKTIK